MNDIRLISKIHKKIELSKCFLETHRDEVNIE